MSALVQALWIVGYLTIGLVLAKVLFKDDVTEDDFHGDDRGVTIFLIATIILAWPLWLAGLVIAGVIYGVKWFILWDPSLTRARRRAKNLEQELEKDAADGS